MFERLLNESEKYIEGVPNKEIPILDLWDALCERSELLTFEMPDSIGDYECMLEADKRFIFIKKKKLSDELNDVDLGIDEGEFEVGEEFFEVEELEKVGFNENQIVGLKKYEKKKYDDDDDDDAPVRRTIVLNPVGSTRIKKKKSTSRPIKVMSKKKKK